MADDKEPKEESKMDAEGMLDKLLSHQDSFATKFDAFMDSVNSRLDAVEDMVKDKKDAKKDGEDEGDKDKKDAKDGDMPGDPEQPVADKKDAKKDGEDEGDKDKKDAKKDGDLPEAFKKEEKKDGEERDEKDYDALHASNVSLRADLERLSKRMAGRSDEDRDAISQAQTRAARIFNAMGVETPQPLMDEDVVAYERRLANRLKIGTSFEKVDLSRINDKTAFDHMVGEIHKAAHDSAMRPANIEPGQLRKISETRDGHTFNTYVGDTGAWMGPISGEISRKGYGKPIGAA